MLLIGFALSIFLFLGIGIASSMYAKNEVDDYLIAGRSVSPVAAGLSAVASNNSGFMFIGAIGFTYAYGLAAFWLFFAWILGDYISWHMVHRELRIKTEVEGCSSLVSFLAQAQDENHRLLQSILGVLTLVFLTLYAAAQFKAGGKALESTLQWQANSGIYIGMIMVAIYSFAGGIRASIWTDVAQSIVMIIAMFCLIVVSHYHIASLGELLGKIGEIDPKLLEWTPHNASLGLIPYALGWAIAGFGGIGQPHIIIRAMTVQSPDSIPTMRRTYFIWYILFSIFTFLVGLYARIYFTGDLQTLFDKETALPMLASAQLTPFFVGFILAAIFAATMSTADSQVLASSASITQDVLRFKNNTFLYSKIATLSVVLVAGIVALVGPDSVFVLVTIAWGLMMTCFGPLMIARIYRWQVNVYTFILSSTLGLTGMFIWSYGLGFGDSMYDGSIGFIIAMGCTFICAKKSADISK